MPDTSVKPAAGTASKDDKSDLAALKKQLADLSVTLATNTATAADLTAQIKTLEARVAEVDKVTGPYGLGYDAQKQELSDDNKWIDDNKTKIPAAVPAAQQQAVKDATKSVDDDLTKQGLTVDTLKTAVETATQTWNDATKEARDNQDNYEKVKLTQKNVDDQLKDIKSLRDQIAKAKAQGDLESMFFLWQEANATAARIVIPTPAEYTDQIKKAQALVEDSKTKVTGAKANLDLQTNLRNGAQASLAAATTARRATILTKSKYPPAAATPALAPAPGSPPTPPATAPSTPTPPTPAPGTPSGGAYPPGGRP
jgi:hypothetical protein